MKHSVVVKEPEFKPVIVTITLETPEEVRHFRNVIGEDDNASTTPLWTSLDEVIKSS